MSVRLKPCPRCNGKLIRLFKEESIVPFEVKCLECGIRTANYQTAEAAIADWNRRVENVKATELRCDVCGREFTPEFSTKSEFDLEYLFFRCPTCLKTYIVSITDDELRKDIKKFEALDTKTTITYAELEELRYLLKKNKNRSQLLKSMYFKEL